MSATDQIFAKCAWRLMPFILILRLVHVLDRSNVGFAALTMNRDLGFSPVVYGFGAGIFFIGYSLFEVPANVVLERVGARRWTFVILALWGTVSAACAFAQGPISFYVLRFLLGVAEGGFAPGMFFYLTLWFPHAYRARLIAMFMAAGPLSFIVGGPLSGFILGMEGIGGMHGWQWLFLIEGVPAAILAFAALRVLPDRPSQASWLSAEEKRDIAALLSVEDATKQHKLWPALRDVRVLALGLVGIGIAFADYGLSLWLPQIVKSLGFSNLATGFIVALPFMAAMGAMVLWGRSSDRRGERVWHVALPVLLAACGLAAASVAPSDLLVLIALGFGVIGVFAAWGPFYSLPFSFLGGRAAAGGIALVLAITNIGGFLGSTAVGALTQATGNYDAGMIALALGLVLTAFIVLVLGRAMISRRLQFS
jgi:ACS family tartrate transporter-like MFS transporter